MTDRADRLSSCRKGRSSDQPAETEEGEKPEQPEEPEQQEESQSAKELYQGAYMYLPENLRQEFDLVARRWTHSVSVGTENRSRRYAISSRWSSPSVWKLSRIWMTMS